MNRWMIVVDGVVVLVGLSLGFATMVLTDSTIATSLDELGFDESALLAGIIVAQQGYNRLVGIWHTVRDLFGNG